MKTTGEYDFSGRSVEELIKSFNADVGSDGWVGARMRFHLALRRAFLDSGLDCSSFIDRGGMSLAHRVKLVGNTIVPIDPNAAPHRGSVVLVTPDP